MVTLRILVLTLFHWRRLHTFYRYDGQGDERALRGAVTFGSILLGDDRSLLFNLRVNDLSD
ncbi:hypothetical protein PSPTOT1_3219 [Pseudomonas syringae pv. tomato T1]|nr:hypothetical protein PSPTOT1_3219 [Pseudomonas syringae pv. tomato T1]